MSTQLLATADHLLAALATSARGPRRNGLFALWMFVRACDGLLPPDGLSARSHRGRLQALERRLSSLSVPAPLKRALASGMRELADGERTAVGLALGQLVAPVRETLGSDVAELIGAAGRIAREATHAPTGGH